MFLRKHLMVIRATEARYVCVTLFGSPESYIASCATHEGARKYTKRNSVYANEGKVGNS
jgi:hypothetical protein